jgi:hypothetical protein
MDQLENLLLETRLQGEASEVWDRLFQHFTILTYFNHPKLHNQSLNYLRYGSAKRIMTIWEDMRWLKRNIPVKRRAPLAGGECRAASLHLNSLYLNIRGCLDNFAWALLWQLAPSEAEKFDSEDDFQRVGLFKKSVLGKLSGTKLKDFLEGCAEWDKDFKVKRDPVAHRLPLFIPPQILKEAEAQEYQALNRQITESNSEFFQMSMEESKRQCEDSFDEIIDKNERVEALIKKHDETQARLYRELESLGAFIPCFGYSKNEPSIPLYPTITEDCKQLANITDNVIAFFNEKLP